MNCLTKIGFFSLYPDKATRVKLQINSLKKAGYEIVLCSPRTHVPFIGRKPNLFIKYIEQTILALTKKVDVIHFSNIPDIPAIGLLLRKSPKIIYDVRSLFSSNIHDLLRLKFFTKLTVGLEQQLFRKADLTITANDYLGRRAKHFGAKKVVTVPNYPKPNFTIVKQTSKLFINKLNELIGSNKNKIFLIVTYMARIKPIDKLILSFNKLNEKYPESKLLIAGSGPDLNRLTKLGSTNKENIHFLGWVGHEDLPYLIKSSDVCIAVYPKSTTYAPGYYSSQSVWKIGEYALYNKPIVGLNMMESPEIIAATEENLDEILIGAFNENVTYDEPLTWNLSEKKLLEAYEDLLS